MPSWSKRVSMTCVALGVKSPHCTRGRLVEGRGEFVACGKLTPDALGDWDNHYGRRIICTYGCGQRVGAIGHRGSASTGKTGAFMNRYQRVLLSVILGILAAGLALPAPLATAASARV